MQNLTTGTPPWSTDLFTATKILGPP
uniref:Uncharacterized protein n=1 Tax=Anguilla anguilla TaxID=7936 RepID=A0A0E9T3F7_ANGAN